MTVPDAKERAKRAFSIRFRGVPEVTIKDAFEFGVEWGGMTHDKQNRFLQAVNNIHPTNTFIRG